MFIPAVAVNWGLAFIQTWRNQDKKEILSGKEYYEMAGSIKDLVPDGKKPLKFTSDSDEENQSTSLICICIHPVAYWKFRKKQNAESDKMQAQNLASGSASAPASLTSASIVPKDSDVKSLMVNEPTETDLITTLESPLLLPDESPVS
jgi:hypothetical protein